MKEEKFQTYGIIFVSIIIIVILVVYVDFIEPSIVVEKVQEVSNENSVVISDEMQDINTASLEDLMEIDGIGEVLAQRIIDKREEMGSFECIEEVILVEGIGDGTLEKIMDKFYVP